jgi:Carbonic anhydrase
MMIGGVTAVGASGGDAGIALDPRVVLTELLAENARFAAGEEARASGFKERREALAKGQKPKAVVLTCSDSRVSPELIFGQGLGDLFVIRNAGNVLDPHVTGSIEYAVGHLGAPLILVVGHERCGAVGAAVADEHAEGKIGCIVTAISPAVEIARERGEADLVDATVRVHARRMAEHLREAGPIISEAVKSGRVRVIAARYDLDTGLVEVLAEDGDAVT